MMDFASIQASIARIHQRIQEPINVTSLQQQECVQFESLFAQQLEEIYFLPISIVELYTNYFTTAEGKASFFSVTGQSIQGDEVSDVARWLLMHRTLITSLPSTEWSRLHGESERYIDAQLFFLCRDRMQDGKLDIRSIPVPSRIVCIVSPEQALEKIKKVIALRQCIIAEQLRLTTEIQSQSEQSILSLYTERIDEWMYSFGQYTEILKHTIEHVGWNQLSDTEQELFSVLEQCAIQQPPFTLDADILQYTQHIEERYIAQQIFLNAQIRAKHIRPEAIWNPQIPVQQFVQFAEEALQHYNLLSTESPALFTPDRTGAASDELWQVIARPEYQSLSVESRQKIIKTGVVQKSIYDVLAVLLGHEIEGHVIQHTNKECIPLRMIQTVGAAESVLLAEGGANMVQNSITREIFGFERISHPHYIRMLERRIHGGNYIECMQAFFESAAQATQEKKKRGLLTAQEYTNELHAHLRLAINRAKRAFRDGPQLDSSSLCSIQSTKDVAYIMQMYVMEELQKAHLKQLAYIGGVSLDSIADLLDNGLLRVEEIQEPRYYAVHIWQQLKSNYSL